MKEGWSNEKSSPRQPPEIFTLKDRAPEEPDGGAYAARSTDESRVAARTAIVLHLLLVFNFCFAPVKDGLAPLVSVFLVAVKGWDPGSAGVIWFARDVSAILCQAFVGGLVDISERKRTLLVLATIVASVSAVSVAWTQNFAFLVVKSVLEGVATCFVQPCKNALILGLIGQEQFDRVAGANEMADHSGSFVGIIVAGTIAYLMYPIVDGVFYVVGGGGLLACLSLVFMPLSIQEDPVGPWEEENVSTGAGERGLQRAMTARNDPLNVSTRSIVSQESSRNLSVGSEASTFASILRDRNIVLFGLSTFFFHLGNAAVLPLLSQILAIDSGRAGLPYTCANVAIAQSTSVLTAWGMGRALARDCSYKLPLIVGYVCAVPVRCCLLVLLLRYRPTDDYALMATQLLDGIGAGTFGLSLPTVTRALTVDTGRFSFTLGLTVTMWMVGSALSNLIGGYVVNFTNYTVGFTALGILGLPSVFLAAFMHARPPQEEVRVNLETTGVFRPRGTRRVQKEDEEGDGEDGQEKEEDEEGDLEDSQDQPSELTTVKIGNPEVLEGNQTKSTSDEGGGPTQKNCDEEQALEERVGQ